MHVVITNHAKKTPDEIMRSFSRVLQSSLGPHRNPYKTLGIPRSSQGILSEYLGRSQGSLKGEAVYSNVNNETDEKLPCGRSLGFHRELLRSPRKPL